MIREGERKRKTEEAVMYSGKWAQTEKAEEEWENIEVGSEVDLMRKYNVAVLLRERISHFKDNVITYKRVETAAIHSLGTEDPETLRNVLSNLRDSAAKWIRDFEDETTGRLLAMGALHGKTRSLFGKRDEKLEAETEQDVEGSQLWTTMFQTAIAQAMPPQVNSNLEEVEGVTSMAHQDLRDHVVNMVERYRKGKKNLTEQQEEVQRKFPLQQLKEPKKKEREESKALLPVKTGSINANAMRNMRS
ncbi:hypothetical protein chiPu_0016334 [Chiloscyllium punctatum]|uniref:Uncharacterized protein n=1 Tax=Chiloscyllium punctatum TaxID=137246 RepID=A0A401T5D1_CHIPU|nr:hypothetical protein [Chiloscyllium punctatum]